MNNILKAPKFWYALTAYVFVAMFFGMLWHTIAFQDFYYSIGAFTRKNIKVEFLLVTKILQGSLLSYLFGKYLDHQNRFELCLKLGLNVSVLMGGSWIFAHAAIINIQHVYWWLIAETFFIIIDGIFTGLAVAMVYSFNNSK